MATSFYSWHQKFCVMWNHWYLFKTFQNYYLFNGNRLWNFKLPASVHNLFKYVISISLIYNIFLIEFRKWKCFLAYLSLTAVEMECFKVAAPSIFIFMKWQVIKRGQQSTIKLCYWIWVAQNQKVTSLIVNCWSRY